MIFMSLEMSDNEDSPLHTRMQRNVPRVGTR